MTRIDDTYLLITAPKEMILFVGNDLDPAISEVATGVGWRGRAHTAAQNLGSNLRNIRVSRGLTDYEKSGRNVAEYERFDAVISDGRKVLAKINDGIAQRTAALVPACKPVWEIDTATMQVDMQWAAAADQWDGDRVRSFLVQLAAGEALPVRIAEALVRVGPSLCKNLDSSWINAEVKRELSDFRNAAKLDGLRQAKIIGSRVERTLDELEEASRTESALARAAVGQFPNAA